jgi:hypothetical protein
VVRNATPNGAPSVGASFGVSGPGSSTAVWWTGAPSATRGTASPIASDPVAQPRYFRMRGPVRGRVATTDRRLHLRRRLQEFGGTCAWAVGAIDSSAYDPDIGRTPDR